MAVYIIVLPKWTHTEVNVNTQGKLFTSSTDILQQRFVGELIWYHSHRQCVSFSEWRNPPGPKGRKHNKGAYERRASRFHIALHQFQHLPQAYTAPKLWIHKKHRFGAESQNTEKLQCKILVPPRMTPTISVREAEERTRIQLVKITVKTHQEPMPPGRIFRD